MAKDLIFMADIKKATRTLRAVNHPLRRKIIHLLDKNEQLNVGELHTRLKIRQSICSSHLAILRKEGIISSKSVGKLRYYSLVKTRINDINTFSYYLAGNE